MSADQLTYLRQESRAAGRVAARPEWMPEFKTFQSDRPLHADIQRIARRLID